MPEPLHTLALLGATGDLSARLLLPALGQVLSGQPDRRLQLIGAGTEDWTDDRWRSVIRTSFATVGASGPAVDHMLHSATYLAADVTRSADLARILKAGGEPATLYFALPPSVTIRACAALEQAGVPPGTGLVLEKPFGAGRESAAALNEQLRKLAPEERIFRVDHFLGIATVFNLVGLRFANRIFEPLWNSQHIDRIDVVFDEDLALEGRAAYYDTAGALRDMIQSHLLLVLAAVAMEPPSRVGTGELRASMAAVLRATRVREDDPLRSSRRARYTAGSIGGRPVPSYEDEPGVDPNRGTDTLAEVTLEIDSWRWAGVPFTLRSGKALAGNRREIAVTFKPAQHVPIGLTGVDEPTRLRLLLEPEGMSLELNVNGPGDLTTIDRAGLAWRFDASTLPAYGRVVEEILDRSTALSVSGAVAEECWRILTPVLDAWAENAVPLETYPAGSAGPDGWAPLD